MVGLSFLLNKHTACVRPFAGPTTTKWICKRPSPAWKNAGSHTRAHLRTKDMATGSGPEAGLRSLRLQGIDRFAKAQGLQRGSVAEIVSGCAVTRVCAVPSCHARSAGAKIAR